MQLIKQCSVVNYSQRQLWQWSRGTQSGWEYESVRNMQLKHQFCVGLEVTYNSHYCSRFCGWYMYIFWTAKKDWISTKKFAALWAAISSSCRELQPSAALMGPFGSVLWLSVGRKDSWGKNFWQKNSEQKKIWQDKKSLAENIILLIKILVEKKL